MLYIFIAGVLWGTIGIFVKQLASLGADPSATSFMRMLFAFVIMTLSAVFRHGRKVLDVDRKTLFLCALLGLVCHGFFNIFYTSSIRANGMGIASVLLYTAPVFTAVASGLIFREKFSALKVFALAVNIIGCVLTVTGGEISGGNFTLGGILAGIGSGFCYGMAAVIGRQAGRHTDALIISAYSYMFAVIFLLLFNTPHMKLEADIILMGFLYGLIPTSLAYLVYYIGLKRIEDTSRVPVIASIEPVTAVAIGMLLYNEHLGTVNFIGVAVVLFSIIIMIKAE